MNKRPFIASLVASLLVVAAAAGLLLAGERPQLGLDLRGGISAIYTPVLQEGAEQPDDFEAVLDQTISVIRARVDSLGVAEPDITRQGTDIVVQLPGIQDVERAQEVIGTTAELEFRPVEEVLSPGMPGYEEGPDCDAPADERPELAEEEGGILCAAPPDPDDAEEPASPAPDTEPTPEPTPDDGTGTEGAAGSAPSPGALARARADAAAQTDASPSPTATPSPGESPSPGASPPPPVDPDAQLKYRVGPAALTGDAIEDAFPQLGQGGGGGWSTALELDGPGGQAFAEITGELACQRDQGEPGLLAIVLDGVVESAPQMNPEVRCGEGITGGQASITSGQGTPDEQEADARDLALILETGALPITLEPSTFETVSPTLGAESLRSGMVAGLLGLLLVAIWLTFYYRWLGLVAIAALAVFGVVVVGLITALGTVGFALTLAGIAGLIVSIGITADSSIIFFERIRDEARLGKTVRTSVKGAFRSAFRTNLAGNTVTLAAAIILYFLAVGPVRGFALMLGIASVLDILILWGFTRPVVSLISTTRVLSRRSLRVARPAPAAGGGR